MDRKQITAAVGGSLGTLALGGALIAGLSSANASDTAAPAAGSSPSTTSGSATASNPAPTGSNEAGQDQNGRPGGHEFGGRHGGGRGFGFGMGQDLAKQLATKLGVSQTTVENAIQTFAKNNRPERPNASTDPKTKPTDAQRQAQITQMKDKLASSLATSLKLDKAKVLAALNAVQANQEAQRLTDLTKRLDAAVSAGKITKADEASIIKAVKAGVLPGWGR